MGKRHTSETLARLRNGFLFGCGAGTGAAVGVLTFVPGAVDAARLAAVGCATAGTAVGLLPRRYATR